MITQKTCACVSDSARLCTLLRYGRDIDSREQHDDDCECLCHQLTEDDDFWGQYGLGTAMSDLAVI